MAHLTSEWECHLFGSSPENPGIVWRPRKGYAPSLFVRVIVRVFFDCRWIKRPSESAQ